MTIEQFADLVELQLRDFIRSDYVSLLTDLQDHPLAKALINKMRMNRNGVSEQAEGFFWELDMSTESSYRHISTTTPDTVNITQGFVHMQVPWKKVETKYGFYQEEIDFNMGANQIVDLVKARERRCDFHWIEGVELDGWNAPVASDPLSFYSIPYWITKNATAGFNGGILSGFANKGGLSPTTWPRIKNYTFQYTNVTLNDFVSLARDMADLTGWKPPIPGVPDLGEVKGPSKAYYTTRTVRKSFADVADSRNDDLGPDVAEMDGKVMFRGAEIVWVPALDADSTGPFYQIPWDVFKLVPQSNWFQRRTMIKPYPGHRNQVAVFKDTYMNFACFNMRACGVGATGTSYP